MTRKRIGAVILLFMLIVNGCSLPEIQFNAHELQFNAEDIQIRLINSQLEDGIRSYTVEVRNNGLQDVEYVNLYLYYPIIKTSGSEGNPFKLEGQSGVRPNHLKAGGALIFTFTAPIFEVFGTSAPLDWDHPQIELNGLVQDGKSEVPFEMSGDYLEMK
ncbi:hypothetical protein [Paenibacillus xylaniclasticus]|uniref:hypothetical protein n=1 Tax=Paenibacillus xylaniclasticus TaxID=588083 RepID=UPI000FDB668E|nr:MULTISPECIES: hypothetical protein [Paenibacillus]GFN30263.1 hypothetical protein PCURB6_05230 [Paenibacillus curdlanolyticus]